MVRQVRPQPRLDPGHHLHGDQATICVLCGDDCEHDGVLHESDCGHGWVVCSTCAVQTCDDCIDKPEIVAHALRRDPSVRIGIDAAAVARLNEKLSGVTIAEVAEPLRMFMNATVPCGPPCPGRMVYVQGSERWPTSAEETAMQDTLLAYDRACSVCKRNATSMLGAPSFDDDLNEEEAFPT